MKESIELYIQFCKVLEINRIYKVRTVGEPMLSKHGLYSTISKVGSTSNGVQYLNVLNSLDGKNDLIDVAQKLQKPFFEIAEVVQELEKFNLIREVRGKSWRK